MRRLFTLGVAAAALALTAGPAGAYVIVTGDSLAARCYDMSRTGRADHVALQECTRALTEDELTARDRAATYVNRGVIQSRRGNESAALADFEAAIASDEAVPEGHTNYGAMLLAQHDYQGAIASISRGINLGPSEAHKAYFNRAVAYEETRNYRGAYDDYRRAAELAPDWEPPRLELTRFQVR